MELVADFLRAIDYFVIHQKPKNGFRELKIANKQYKESFSEGVYNHADGDLGGEYFLHGLCEMSVCQFNGDDIGKCVKDASIEELKETDFDV